MATQNFDQKGDKKLEIKITNKQDEENITEENITSFSKEN